MSSPLQSWRRHFTRFPIHMLEPEVEYSGYKLLLVEDDATNAVVAEELLISMGFSVDIAENGRKCIEMIQNTEYSFILMDCTMPVLDGYETTKRIRILEIEGIIERCPIVALTGNTGDGEREKCLEVGMDDYIPKPVSEEALYEAIEKHLERDNLNDI